ncbi:UNVERIFIED_CONTAM: hypothetical protein Sindi_1662900 [Sesamum indicum]
MGEKSPRRHLESGRAQVDSRRWRVGPNFQGEKASQMLHECARASGDELCELFEDGDNETIWISDDEEDADDPFGANPDLYDSHADVDSALPNPLKHDGGSSSKSLAPDKPPSEG